MELFLCQECRTLLGTDTGILFWEQDGRNFNLQILRLSQLLGQRAEDQMFGSAALQDLESILHMNYLSYDSFNRKSYYNLIAYFDFAGDIADGFTDVLVGHNITFTPWIGDIDSDGFLDLVYSNSTNLKLTYQFDEVQLNLIKTMIPISGKIEWGAYMGSNYNGIYKPY